MIISVSSRYKQVSISTQDSAITQEVGWIVHELKEDVPLLGITNFQKENW